MRIAIPLTQGQLAQHFGHCEKFALMDVDLDQKTVTASKEVEAPEHQPGLLPRWLKDLGVDLVIAGGLGSRAQALFEEVSIKVLTGAPTGNAASLATQYLAGSLVSRPVSCGHGGCH